MSQLGVGVGVGIPGLIDDLMQLSSEVHSSDVQTVGSVFKKNQ